MKLNSEEVVLIPFRFVIWKQDQNKLDLHLCQAQIILKWLLTFEFWIPDSYYPLLSPSENSRLPKLLPDVPLVVWLNVHFEVNLEVHLEVLTCSDHLVISHVILVSAQVLWVLTLDFGLQTRAWQYSFSCNIFRFRIPNVTERLRSDSEGRTLSSNLVFTIWAVFGGFILHFLLSNYLTVLMMPSYEEPVETAKDLIKRDITPILLPGGEIYKQLFAASQDPNYQEISRRLVIPKDYDEYDDLVSKVISTGMYAQMGTVPWAYEEEYKDWYRSTETITGDYPYGVHLSNKKWPLKKVLYSSFVIVRIISLLFIFRNMILICSD